VTQNIVFSPPVSAKVKPEDCLSQSGKRCTRSIQTIALFLAIITKKEHPHVHVVFRIRDKTETSRYKEKGFTGNSNWFLRRAEAERL
jgi:hypothetical protein